MNNFISNTAKIIYLYWKKSEKHQCIILPRLTLISKNNTHTHTYINKYRMYISTYLPCRCRQCSLCWRSYTYTGSTPPDRCPGDDRAGTCSGALNCGNIAPPLPAAAPSQVQQDPRFPHPPPGGACIRHIPDSVCCTLSHRWLCDCRRFLQHIIHPLGWVSGHWYYNVAVSCRQ